MRRLFEATRLDLGLLSQALNNSNATGRYFSTKNCRRLLGLLNVAAMAATKTAIIELLQATDGAGTGSKGVPTTVGQLAKATIVANTKVTEMTVTLASFVAGGVITINDLDFTAHDTVTTPANREFSISGSDTADGDELCVCINDATYGVPGVTASNAAGVVTLKSTVAGGVVITTSSVPDDGTVVKATVAAQAYVEIETAKLDHAGGFTWVAVKITVTSDSVVAAALLRGDLRFDEAQKMGAAAAV